MSQLFSSPSVCPHCEKPVQPTDSYCLQCGFPLQGDDEAVRQFRIQQLLKKQRNDEHLKKLRQGTQTLYVVAGFMVVSGIVLYFINDDTIALVLAVFLALVYVGLAIASKKNPFSTTLIGLILFITLQVLNVIIDPVSLAKGIIVKILVIAYLVRAVRSAYQLKTELTDSTG